MQQKLPHTAIYSCNKPLSFTYWLPPRDQDPGSGEWLTSHVTNHVTPPPHTNSNSQAGLEESTAPASRAKHVRVSYLGIRGTSRVTAHAHVQCVTARVYAPCQLSRPTLIKSRITVCVLVPRHGRPHVKVKSCVTAGVHVPLEVRENFGNCPTSINCYIGVGAWGGRGQGRLVWGRAGVGGWGGWME